ncbi:ThiJ PfpI family protein [Geosmithia morbida]|uniref:ThiJ PfpI family protein n=1 Tax=Geosmithia morbida TaxID=1094350 RepID=A0A9P4YLN3_9HYPO|nr:ThiJ PfpI family protein [Geosmithia morbida]KAF4119256.1 ThiJ PfpI family protein [Geosmithia morbida]
MTVSTICIHLPHRVHIYRYVFKMPATKTSAVADEQEPINVLFALHPKFDLLDFAGPVEVFSTALHDRDDPSSRAFEITLASSEPQVLSEQGIIVNSHITFKEAHDNLEDYDVLVVLGGNMLSLVKTEDQPAGLIVDFSELQKKEPARERTLLSVCTGSLLLAKEGILSGLSATTHPDFLTTFENLCSDAATRNLQERTDIVEDARYVVNNLRFDLDGEDSSPYIPMRLGGLRVITSGGNSAGIDAALYLVSAMVDEECAFAVSRMMQWNWTKGVVVDGLDV